MRGVHGIAGVTGGTLPAQIWHTYMTDALQGLPVEQFAGTGSPPYKPWCGRYQFARTFRDARRHDSCKPKQKPGGKRKQKAKTTTQRKTTTAGTTVHTTRTVATTTQPTTTAPPPTTTAPPPTTTPTTTTTEPTTTTTGGPP